MLLNHCFLPDFLLFMGDRGLAQEKTPYKQDQHKMKQTRKMSGNRTEDTSILLDITKSTNGLKK